MIGEDDVEQDNTPRLLTSEEFAAMMRQMDQAQEWMIDQLKCRLIAHPSRCPAYRAVDSCTCEREGLKLKKSKLSGKQLKIAKQSP
ncbi:hypothetical protein KDX30_11365 [Pseudomonas sp. CDFA 553]|uniref:hypothetical protein n=1 Tax=Pseudomonas quasicaspiana TaxID=2829821 RepID=UPI001E464646|nr:hypothetical protein [Pseudomonas quasicaspiana]MCD5988499.1 hypothetical protein [Pseudomonas quasicaspiana]